MEFRSTGNGTTILERIGTLKEFWAAEGDYHATGTTAARSATTTATAELRDFEGEDDFVVAVAYDLNGVVATARVFQGVLRAGTGCW